MKLETIQELWSEDSKIDHTELTLEAAKVPQLHHKYYKIYILEKMMLKKYEAEYKTLHLAKYEFYSQGPSPETPKDWVLPPIGRILKENIPRYMDADKDIVELSLRISLQKEKVDYLFSIISTITNRSYLLGTMLGSERFRAGL